MRDVKAEKDVRVVKRASAGRRSRASKRPQPPEGPGRLEPLARKTGAKSGGGDLSVGKDAVRRPPRRGLYGQRPSVSHDEILRKEFARIAAMSARERMMEALRLDEEVRSMLASPSRERARQRPSKEKPPRKSKKRPAKGLGSAAKHKRLLGKNKAPAAHARGPAK